jgi:hypothetical protein
VGDARLGVGKSEDVDPANPTGRRTSDNADPAGPADDQSDSIIPNRRSRRSGR